MAANIIDRGRGPEIEGTRITVYDVMDYLTTDWDQGTISAVLDISPEEIGAATKYIDEHKAEVTAAYQKILKRGVNATTVQEEPPGYYIEKYIHDRGRGPEIKGSRITVYDVMDYYTDGWRPGRIATMFKLTEEEIVAAIKYIEAHKAEVLAEYQIMLDRDAKGNPPELQKRLDETHERVQAMLKERQSRRAQEAHNA